jgi:hypothetical protein
VAVDTEAGVVMIAGDCANCMENIVGQARRIS